MSAEFCKGAQMAMSRHLITRRVAAAGVLLAAVANPWTAAAAEPARFRDIKLDLAPLRATGDAISADAFAKRLPGLLRDAFAEHLTPADRSAPSLVARVDSVSYGPATPHGLTGMSATDFVTGAALVESGGRILATYPLIASRIERTDLGDRPTADGELYRTDRLAELFAFWLPRQMGF